jgi:DNA-binding protein YbaB
MLPEAPSNRELLMPQGSHLRAVRNPVDSLLSVITESDEHLARIRAHQAELRGRGTTANGRVVAEVLSSGALVSLSIDPRAMRLGSEVLADEILAAVRKAAQDVSGRATELMEPSVTELMGDQTDDGTDIEQVLAALRDIRRQFGV